MNVSAFWLHYISQYSETVLFKMVYAY